MLREEDDVFRSNGTVRKRTEAPPPSSGKKYRPMEDIMRTAKIASPVNGDYYSDVRCEQCRSGEREDELVLCDRCDVGYHLYCLRPIAVRVPSGPWFCPSCSGGRAVRRFPQLKMKIVDFFRIQQSKNAPGVEELRAFHGDAKKRRRRSMRLVILKKRRRILPFTPSKNPKQRFEQMCSLATALTALGMEFCNDLTYMPGMAPRSANMAICEKGGMQHLAKKDKETLEICRTLCRRGECPPLVVVFDTCEGFTVEADEDIKDMTFITEYTGDVDYLENREVDDCETMMTLLLSSNPSHSLVVCPDKRGNIACFISGINNHTLEGRKKQNLKCVRYNVDGECRVLLVTCRDIYQGERLYYDYNGYEQEYPTQHFF